MHDDYFHHKESIKYCGMHSEPIKPYKIRDKVYKILLFKYGEGEPPFKEIIVFASDGDDAKRYYNKYKEGLPEHQAISIEYIK
jgi:hypothetical protein